MPEKRSAKAFIQTTQTSRVDKIAYKYILNKLYMQSYKSNGKFAYLIRHKFIHVDVRNGLVTVNFLQLNITDEYIRARMIGVEIEP